MVYMMTICVNPCFLVSIFDVDDTARNIVKSFYGLILGACSSKKVQMGLFVISRQSTNGENGARFMKMIFPRPEKFWGAKIPIFMIFQFHCNNSIGHIQTIVYEYIIVYFIFSIYCKLSVLKIYSLPYYPSVQMCNY